MFVVAVAPIVAAFYFDVGALLCCYSYCHCHCVGTVIVAIVVVCIVSALVVMLLFSLS